MLSVARLGLSGQLTVTVRDLDGRIIDVWHGRNVITREGQQLLRDALADGIDARLRYMALGDDDTPATDEDLALGNERLRKQITQRSTISHNQLATTTYIAPGEANDFPIREVGWFAGPAATATPGSGILYARLLFSRDKTALESIQADRLDTISEVT